MIILSTTVTFLLWSIVSTQHFINSCCFSSLCCGSKLVKLITWNICTSLILGLLNYPFPSSSTGKRDWDFLTLCPFLVTWLSEYITACEQNQLRTQPAAWACFYTEFTSLWRISCERSCSLKGCITRCSARLPEQCHTNCPVPHGKHHPPNNQPNQPPWTERSFIFKFFKFWDFPKFHKWSQDIRNSLDQEIVWIQIQLKAKIIHWSLHKLSSVLTFNQANNPNCICGFKLFCSNYILLLLHR